MVQPGTLLEGKYRLVEPIGEGGMGSVWRAEHVTLARRVAIKFIRADHDPGSVSRFEREARVAAQIHHRHVVDIIDFGTTPDDRTPYIVMELLEGETLTQRMDRSHPIPVPELLDIAIAALSGLEAVHAAGIVHRDLKPDNIFLVRELDEVVPKILDFGMSRVTDASPAAPANATITGGGMIVGTPYYMSAEQASGQRDVDFRSDLYSVGVILYEALTGKVPFDADTLDGLIVKVASGTFEPIAASRRDLTPELVAVVERAMSRDRDARFTSARELRLALVGARGGRLQAPTSVPTTAVRERAEPAPPAPTPSTIETAPKLSMGDLYTLVAAPRGRRRTGRTVAIATAIAVSFGGAGVAVALLSRSPSAVVPHSVPSSPAVAPLAPAISPPPPEAPPAPVAPPAPSPVASPASPAGASPPVEIVVRLRALPSEARVAVDGTRSAGPELRLPRDGQLRRIEVTAPGFRTWSTVHPCTQDGAYDVNLAAVAARPARNPPRFPRAETPPARGGEAPAPPPAGGLLGDPGF